MGAFPPIDSQEFIRLVNERLVSSVSMLPQILKKQSQDLGIMGPVPPAKIELLIKKTVEAVDYFVGKEAALRVRRQMKKVLKQMAPEYFNSKYMF